MPAMIIGRYVPGIMSRAEQAWRYIKRKLLVMECKKAAERSQKIDHAGSLLPIPCAVMYENHGIGSMPHNLEEM